MNGSGRTPVTITVNEEPRVATVSASLTLVEFLRSELGLTGTKVACDGGECGACTVLVDGNLVLSCLVLAVELDGHAVTTIEAVGNERICRLQRAFVAESALQCGYCTPGMILAACALDPGAGADEIRAALAGNLCRCTGYKKIYDAVRVALDEEADDGETI